ncbi:MAG TPA: transcription antitermination factor NusB [Alphaproteobacteria bacterium]|nr:transcription antitermination factor NusB [Alphaproteobacteria bacterium]
MTDASFASRRAALDLLEAVLQRHQPLDDALETHPGLKGLEPRDRGFTRLLTATVLRRLGQIDSVIEGFLEKPLPAKAATAQDLLRIGTAQLLFLGTPPHAAVATAVTLAERRRMLPYKGLINAVLRKISAAGPESLLAGKPAGPYNTPAWLWDSWAAAYGEPAAAAIAEAHAEEPPLDLTPKADAATWANTLEARLLPTGTLRRALGGPVSELPGFAEGAWWVQDAAAALPARLLGDVAGRRVADLCAAPGGKTAQLCAAGADVVAVDRNPKRLERLKANLARLGLTAETVAADAAAWEPEGRFDAVLLDAPCSATGTIRRHPDVPHLKDPDDLPKLTALQDRLLRRAVDLLEPGGVMVYCTCSLQPEEGEQRIAALLAGDAPVRRSPIRAEEVGGLGEVLNEAGELRSLPSHLSELGGIDGFFAARLVKAG